MLKVCTYTNNTARILSVIRKTVPPGTGMFMIRQRMAQRYRSVKKGSVTNRKDRPEASSGAAAAAAEI